MPYQVYDCPEHGEFAVVISWRESVTIDRRCPECGLVARWVPKPPYIMALDRRTRRRHSYPAEHGIDGKSRRDRQG